MKKQIIVVIGIVLVALLFCYESYSNNHKLIDSNITVVKAEELIDNAKVEEVKKVIVYDGLTVNELISKINLSLKGELANKGNIYVKYAFEYEVDPYLAVAISLHETGCNRECSTLVKKCNNVGGQKGKPSCVGGSYRSYETLDEGIEGFIKNIAVKYYAYDLTTPELMESKYAGSNTWAMKVNRYIDNIKAKDI